MYAHVACPMVPKFYQFIIVNLRQSFYQCRSCAVAILQHCKFNRGYQISKTNLFIAFYRINLAKLYVGTSLEAMKPLKFLVCKEYHICLLRNRTLLLLYIGYTHLFIKKYIRSKL